MEPRVFVCGEDNRPLVTGGYKFTNTQTQDKCLFCSHLEDDDDDDNHDEDDDNDEYDNFYGAVTSTCRYKGALTQNQTTPEIIIIIMLSRNSVL